MVSTGHTSGISNGNVNNLGNRNINHDNINDIPTGHVSVGDRSGIGNGNVNNVWNRNMNHGNVNDIPNGNVSVSDRSVNGNVNHVENRNMNHGSVNDIPNGNVSIGDRSGIGNGNVNHVGNRSMNHLGNGYESISDRLARVGNTLDRARQFYLFFERNRYVLLNGQRDDRRHISRDRLLLQQLQTFLLELEGLPESVLMSRSLALLRALIAVVEMRVRAYARNVSDSSRMASLVMDYLADVMHM